MRQDLVAATAPLHRAALRFAHGLRLVWWRMAGRDLQGCNAIVSNAEGAVLLVRHSYQARDRWMLPGGGIARGESVVAAAVREVLEETGCRMVEAQACGTCLATLAGCRHHVHLVAGVTSDQPRADGREICEARFFPADALPPTLAAGARERLEHWRRWRSQNNTLASAAQNSGSSGSAG